MYKVTCKLNFVNETAYNDKPPTDPKWQITADKSYLEGSLDFTDSKKL